ncbi:MAG: hypothetical protein RSD81_21510 [Pseudomonas sp.]
MMAKIDETKLLEQMVQGEGLMALALESMQRYENAKGVLTADELLKLRQEAEALFQAVQSYQLRVLGGVTSVLH